MLNRPPVISVIMAVFNEAATVGRAINSILEQTENDFELIVVDDGSTDNTCEIVESMRLNDNRIVLVKNANNCGLATSLNNGISIAKGDYMARMDADDISYSQRFELQKRFLDHHPEIAVVGGNADYINQSGTVEQKTNLPLQPKSINNIIMRRNPLIHPAVMFRRAFIEALGGYDEKHRRKQDYDLWLRGCTQFQYANIPESLIKYQARDSNPFKTDLYGFYIMILNAFRLRRYFSGTYWAFVTLGINILRKFGYKQRIFRQDDHTEK